MPETRSRSSRVPEETQDHVAEKAAAARENGGDIVDQAKQIFEVRGVHAKLNLILHEMPDTMRPEGRNKHFDYDYWSLDQISGYFRNRFGDLGLSFMADVENITLTEHKTARGGSSMLTTLLVLFTITDFETGETVSGHGVGQGDDPGDKGANKAFSGALKYWLLKVFIVGGEDSEADERTDRRAEARGRRRGPADEDQNVVIGDSKIEGIARGGRSSHTTDVQLRQIQHLAKDLEWNAPGAARRIAEWVGDEIDLGDDPELERDNLRRYLEGLSSEDAGRIITKMSDLKDAPDEDDENDDADRGAGYGEYS